MDVSTHGSQVATAAAKSLGSGASITALLPFDWLTMTVGLVSALMALLHTNPPEGQTRTPLRVFLLVASSGFLSGALVPVAVAGGVNYLPWLQSAGPAGMQYAAAAALGVFPHIVGPAWRAWREYKGVKA